LQCIGLWISESDRYCLLMRFKNEYLQKLESHESLFITTQLLKSNGKKLAGFSQSSIQQRSKQ
jgi:hypothetical protein